jgi:hypothetical protein
MVEVRVMDDIVENCLFLTRMERTDVSYMATWTGCAARGGAKKYWILSALGDYPLTVLTVFVCHCDVSWCNPVTAMRLYSDTTTYKRSFPEKTDEWILPTPRACVSNSSVVFPPHMRSIKIRVLPPASSREGTSSKRHAYFYYFSLSGIVFFPLPQLGGVQLFHCHQHFYEWTPYNKQVR